MAGELSPIDKAKFVSAKRAAEMVEDGMRVGLGTGSTAAWLVRCLGEMGVPCRPYFTPIHLQPFYRERFGYRRGDFPVTERLGDVSLALPFSGVMAEDQVDRVCAALERVLLA